MSENKCRQYQKGWEPEAQVTYKHMRGVCGINQPSPGPVQVQVFLLTLKGISPLADASPIVNFHQHFMSSFCTDIFVPKF